MAGTKLSGRRHFQTNNNYFFKGETSFSSQVRSSLRWLLKKLLLAPTPEVNPFPPADSALEPEGGREEEGKKANGWERLPVLRSVGLAVDLRCSRKSSE